MTNSADPDQLAFQKPADLDLHSLQRQSISVSAGLMLKCYSQLQQTSVAFSGVFLRENKAKHLSALLENDLYENSIY